MVNSLNRVTSGQFVTDIVTKDYRTAEVFRKYNIDFCCGGKMPLSVACELNGINEVALIEELEEFPQVYESAKSWTVEFTIDYLTNLHHSYFKNNLPVTLEYVDRFITGHIKKIPEFRLLPEFMNELNSRLNEQILYESERLFPYIKRISYAHNNNEVYGKLLIRTLHKLSVEDLHQYHTPVIKLILQIQEVSQNFLLPTNACTTHKVMLQKLEEFTGFIRQHILIEKRILLPVVRQMEKHLLEKFAEVE